MRWWCTLVAGLLALAVSLSASTYEEIGNYHYRSSNDSSFGVADHSSNQTTLLEVDYLDDDDHQELSTEEYLDDEYQLDEGEMLPDPEALTDNEQEEEEEVVYLDSETRIVAEQLIQELDDIGNKLQNDEETLGTSRAVSSAEVEKLEKLLESAGLTTNSPFFHGLMQQQRHETPVSDPVGPSTAISLPYSGSTYLIAPSGLNKKNVEDIKLELKHMLFGPDNNQRRRQGTSGIKIRPVGGKNSQFQQFSDTAARRPLEPSSTRRRAQNKNGKKRMRLRNKAEDRQQSPTVTTRPPIPLFLRPPRPARPASGRPATSSRPSPIGSRPAVNEITRQPINEFRPPSSDFRLPEAPFRQQIASTNFVQPPRTAANINNAAVRSQVFAPVQQREQQQQTRQSFSPSAPLPRPTEEQFRPALLNGGGRPISSQPAPPRQFIQAPARPSQQQPTVVLGPQQRQPINTNPVLPPPSPGRLQPARPISTGGGVLPANSPNRGKIIQPECNLFSEGICLEVRNYPTELISNYLSRNKPALETMLAEVRSQSADDLVDGITSAEERRYSYNHYYGSRRQGEDNHAHRDFAEDGGFLCPSEVKYARPQLAQTSRGVWKYIINMADHTQTIRMERCLKPASGCSYVSPHYKSHCIQVYNYHRLLSFEEGKGMHVDIYKIPVGCSCHVQGYAYLYPPLDGKIAGHIIPPAFTTEAAAAPGNNLGPNRKTSSGPTRDRVSPSPSLNESPESREEPSLPPNLEDNFNVPSGMKEFSSFMDQQFSGHFGPFGSRGGSSDNRRRDDYDVDERDQQPMESNAEMKNPKRTRPMSKTNYDYHPIIDYFNDKP